MLGERTLEYAMNDIAEKIHLIERLSSSPTATANLLDKVIESLVEADRRKLASFQRKLAEFEQHHGMSTADFQARFDAGELGDASEWFDWDGYAALSASLEHKLHDAGVLGG